MENAKHSMKFQVSQVTITAEAAALITYKRSQANLK